MVLRVVLVILFVGCSLEWDLNLGYEIYFYFGFFYC